MTGDWWITDNQQNFRKLGSNNGDFGRSTVKKNETGKLRHWNDNLTTASKSVRSILPAVLPNSQFLTGQCTKLNNRFFIP